MTAGKKFKQRVRARSAKTGESYTAALRHFRRASGDAMSEQYLSEQHPSQSPSLRLAVAQTRQREDPRDPDLLRASGAEVRELITRARNAGARLVQFPEGALCFPHKRVLSSRPDRVGPADWSVVDWDTYAAELDATARLAGRLGIWVALPAAHRLSAGHRPHNSLYVIDDHGRVHTRYDERFGSQTKIDFMYTPGTEPVTFEIDGLRIGCALGIEAVHPKSFTDYEAAGCALIIFSTSGQETPAPHPTPFYRNLAVYAGVNGCWISMASTLAGNTAIFGPGNVTPVRITDHPGPALVVAEVDHRTDSKPWLDRLRSGAYDAKMITDDDRSLQRTSF
ncbi:carbon-nitrogen hydrolase family protein [Microlunatus elymi]|uniref:Carbon-nitrogen hydrolase family protein n=1 Tax=Microlunatus elymi TaxID=2596828 RepID=A0A516Q0Q7_9ACTN|nr:carbon-nitrogen hydrolase family protein [Microlunatus elymi]QDP96988.1 carbon-nitrogen hydrolase family protein [Microlunatus elymi]